MSFAPIHLLDTVPSTNALARERILEGAAVPGETFIARAQSQGRGRLGRTWHSPPGDGLYISLIARPRDCPNARLPQLSLAAGVVMAQSIEALCGLEVVLKWPNDLLVSRRKLGGILCESVLIGSRVEGVVIGVGVNLLGTPETFPHALTVATSVEHALGAKPEPHLRMALATRFRQQMLPLAHSFDATARSHIRQAWRDRAWLDTRVRLSDGRDARVCDLTEDGGLELEAVDTGARFMVNSGEMRWMDMDSTRVE